MAVAAKCASTQLPRRAWIEASVETLIAMLDEIDGDADIERDDEV